MTDPHPNLFADGFEYDEDDPEGFRCGVRHLGRLAGGQENSVKLFELPAGQALCPYHYEYVEEWLLVLQGSVELRTPAGAETIPPGAAVCFPAGPDGAHKVAAPPDGAARVVMFSSSREPSVAVYPDSDKIGVWAGDPRDELMVRRADAKVDYWDGESA